MKNIMYNRKAIEKVLGISDFIYNTKGEISNKDGHKISITKEQEEEIRKETEIMNKKVEIQTEKNKIKMEMYDKLSKLTIGDILTDEMSLLRMNVLITCKKTTDIIFWRDMNNQNIKMKVSELKNIYKEGTELYQKTFFEYMNKIDNIK